MLWHCKSIVLISIVRKNFTEKSRENPHSLANGNPSLFYATAIEGKRPSVMLDECEPLCIVANGIESWKGRFSKAPIGPLGDTGTFAESDALKG